MSSIFANRGYMLVEEPICEVTGELLLKGPRKLEFDIVRCGHCLGIIRVGYRINPGCVVPENRYTCKRCDEPICRHCAENLGGAEGNCLPAEFQVEYKMKHGVRPADIGLLDYRSSF